MHVSSGTLVMKSKHVVFIAYNISTVQFLLFLVKNTEHKLTVNLTLITPKPSAVITQFKRLEKEIEEKKQV